MSANTRHIQMTVNACCECNMTICVGLNRDFQANQ